MQQGKQPAAAAPTVVEHANHRAAVGIQVHPGMPGIVETQAPDRQAPLQVAHHAVFFARVVIEVVAFQPFGLHRHARQQRASRRQQAIRG